MSMFVQGGLEDEGEIETLKSKVAELEAQVVEANGSADDLQGENDKLINTIAEMDDKIEDANDEKESACQWGRDMFEKYKKVEAENKSLLSRIEKMWRPLNELYALVKGECPSLLNEDSGGDAQLNIDIEKALASDGRGVDSDK